jgi:hypothetical protein
MPEQRHVVPNADGGWDVKGSNADRASSHHDAKDEAVQRAREILVNEGGGELFIHGSDGQIQTKDTVASGNDPYPPPG